MFRRAQAQVIVFLATNTSGVRQTGVNWADGEVKLSKNGAAFVDLLGSRITEVGLGYYSVTLTATEADATYLVLAQVKTGIASTNDVGGLTSGHPSGAVIADAGNTATTFKTNLASAVNDFYKGQLVRFTTGTLAGQIGEIASYSGATTKFVTLTSALTSVPADADKFILIEV